MRNIKLKIRVFCNTNGDFIELFTHMAECVEGSYLPLDFKLCPCDEERILYRGTDRVKDTHFYVVNWSVRRW